MKILYQDIYRGNRTVAQIILENCGHMVDLVGPKEDLEKKILDDYKAIIIDADTFMVPGDRSKTNIGDYFKDKVNGYTGRIILTTTQSIDLLKKELKDYSGNVEYISKPINLPRIGYNLNKAPKK